MQRLEGPIGALIFRVLAAGLSFLFGVVAARILGVDQFGIASVLLGMVNIGLVIALLGHETLATRQVATLTHQNTLRYQRSASRQTWMAGLATLALAVTIVQFLPIGMQAGTAFLALLVLIPLMARTRLSQGLIRGAHLPSLSLLPDGIVRPSLAMGLLLLLAYFGYDKDSGFAAALLISAILAMIYGIWLEHRAVTKTSVETADPPQQKPAFFSRDIFISSVLAVLVAQIALVATGLLATPKDAGLFAAAERFALAAGLIGQTVYLAVASRLATHHNNAETQSMRALIRRSTRIVSISTIGLCIFIAIAANTLLDLYGQGFSEAKDALYLLLAATAFNAIAGPTGQVLLMTKHEGLHLLAMLASLIIQAALIIALVPEYGFNGAALATLISTVIWNGLMMYFIKLKLTINPILAWA